MKLDYNLIYWVWATADEIGGSLLRCFNPDMTVIHLCFSDFCFYSQLSDCLAIATIK